MIFNLKLSHIVEKYNGQILQYKIFKKEITNSSQINRVFPHYSSYYLRDNSGFMPTNNHI